MGQEVIVRGWKLVDQKTGDPVCYQDVREVRGTKYSVQGGQPPRHAASTGRIWVRDVISGMDHEYFPGVVDTKWEQQ